MRKLNFSLGLFLIISGIILILIVSFIYLLEYYRTALLIGSIVSTILGIIITFVGIGRRDYINNKENK